MEIDKSTSILHLCNICHLDSNWLHVLHWELWDVDVYIRLLAHIIRAVSWPHPSFNDHWAGRRNKPNDTLATKWVKQRITVSQDHQVYFFCLDDHIGNHIRGIGNKTQWNSLHWTSLNCQSITDSEFLYRVLDHGIRYHLPLTKNSLVGQRTRRGSYRKLTEVNKENYHRMHLLWDRSWTWASLGLNIKR